jgi:hypothetical protein
MTQSYKSNNPVIQIIFGSRMRYLLIISLFILLACGGSLSEDQKKRIRESMEEGQIRKVSDAELTEAAFAYGRTIIDDLEVNQNLSNSSAIDSLEKVYGVKIVSLKTGDSALMEIEKQIIEAYTSGGSLDLPDNIQRFGTDSLLYTKPIMEEKPDGSVEFVKAIGIHLPKKQVVLSIKD